MEISYMKAFGGGAYSEIQYAVNTPMKAEW